MTRVGPRHAVEGGECECAAMLAAGAYGGWYCPKHGFTDTTPPEYVIEAVRRLNDRVLELENWKYQRQKADATAALPLPHQQPGETPDQPDGDA